MNKGYLYADITKAERDENGDLIVTGIAASPTKDIDKQIADPTWLKSAMPAWMTWGNVREQHSKIAAGIGMELVEGDGDTWTLKAAVIDPVTATKVEKHVLKGFSVGIKGPRYVADKSAPGGRIVGGEIVEISLVDRPANPDCLIELAKSAGGEWHPADVEKAADDDTVDCPTCDGDGKIRAGKVGCPDCGGDGTVTKAKAAELKKSVELDADAITEAGGLDKFVQAELEKKALSSAEMNDLPDSSFAYVEPGGSKDDDGKTAPRSKRHFAIHDKAHVQNALSRAPQSPFGDKAMPKIKKAAEKFGVEVSKAVEVWESAVNGDLLKADDTSDDETSDIENAAAALKILATLIQSEAAGLAEGDMSEANDIDTLLSAVRALRWFVQSEQAEAAGNQGDDVSILSFGVDPDIVKAATADDATDEAKDAYRAELTKALGIDDKIAAVIPDAVKGLLEERDAALEERIKRVEDAAAPGGPVTTRTQAEAAKATEADRLRGEAAHYRQIAGTVDHTTRTAYLEKATECDRQANALSTTT
ncbi:MAG TPA: hypothetical protein VGP46_01185 [Acidimicrobiales bacterium]|jgi:hypothetical protein|nr:hypothetical protein [Acidimicrobiales bacterium]